MTTTTTTTNDAKSANQTTTLIENRTENPDNKAFTFVVEHLDPEFGPWSRLEYRTIGRECWEVGCRCLVFLGEEREEAVVGAGGSGGDGADGIEDGVDGLEVVRGSTVERVFGPAGTTGAAVSGESGEGESERSRRRRVCLLDPKAERELSVADGEVFDVFLFGGILGDDPPRDRTSELRNKGYEGRRLGPKQMTTDTAVRVTRMVVHDGVPLTEIPYVDHPELKLDEHESTEMPFRYVKGPDGAPVMPEGMIELIKKDADKGFDDFLEG